MSARRLEVCGRTFLSIDVLTQIPSSPEEYAALKASIRRHGRCYEPVIKNKNGKVISGSDRLRACAGTRVTETQKQS